MTFLKKFFSICQIFCLLGSISFTVSAQEKPQDFPVSNNFAGNTTYSRIGIDENKVLALSLEDTVKMVLDRNLDVQIEKGNIKLAEYSFQSARGFYDLSLGSFLGYKLNTTPIVTSLESVTGTKFRNEFYTYNFNVSRELGTGGSLRADFNNQYIMTSSQFFTVNPGFVPELILTYKQPLLKNLTIDQNRKKIRRLQKDLALADLSFRQNLVTIIAQTQAAYYDLAFALKNQEILQKSVELAVEQLKKTETEIQAGKLAPVEKVVAEAEIERRKEKVINVLNDITEAENSLKTFILDDVKSEYWVYRIVPTDLINFVPTSINLQVSLDLAVSNRPELKQFDIQSDINKLELKFLQNQMKPQIDLVANFSLKGLAGTPTPPSFFKPSITPKEFVGGYGTALRNMFDFRSYQVGVTIGLPLKNTTAKANVEQALAINNQLNARKQKMLQTITSEVRNALQQLDSAAQRVRVTNFAVTAAEKQLEAEEVRFEAMMSTSLLVLERQNDLSDARGRKLRAMTDYVKAYAHLQKVMANNLP